MGAAFYYLIMYNTCNVLPLDKEFILSKVSEYELFATYLGFKPEIGKLYISPLRKDSKPSFSLYVNRTGTLRYKDFGTSESGDCFDFISKLSNEKSFAKVLSDIYKSDIKHNLTIKNSPPLLPKIEKRLGINKMSFNKEGLDYWKQYGIDRKTLDYFQVAQVKNIFVNSELVGTYQKGNPIFAYFIYDRLKIYKPLENKFSRFYTDCNKNYIQGWKQMDSSKDVLFITKALKDVMVLHNLGYTAIAPNGEGYDLPAKAIKYIKTNFKRIIVLYDRDTAGITNARKLVKQYELDFMFIPKKWKTKDISDFFQKYGRAETEKLIYSLI